MEQDSVYHHGMDEAGRKIKDGKGMLDKDGHPIIDAARKQRQAAQAEQVLHLFCKPYAGETSSFNTPTS